jgi:hypothetical protein|tara:strand:+ start:1304 stop:1498 length:195 start_codon:yes stop_codon:yes gene_type:complete
MILKKVTGSCLFEYISEFDSEEKALSGLDGTFKEVKISNLKKEKTLITKENNDSKSEGTPKAKG